MMVLAFAEYKHVFLHIEKIILKYFDKCTCFQSGHTSFKIYLGSLRLDIFYLFYKLLVSQIFLFCWQIILLILSNISPIVLLFFLLKAEFLQCSYLSSRECQCLCGLHLHLHLVIQQTLLSKATYKGQNSQATSNRTWCNNKKLLYIRNIYSI